MKLQFRFIEMIKDSRSSTNSQPAVRCGLCIYSVEYSENEPEFRCRGHSSHNGHTYAMNKIKEKLQSKWCSGFLLDITKWKKL